MKREERKKQRYEEENELNGFRNKKENLHDANEGIK